MSFLLSLVLGVSCWRGGTGGCSATVVSVVDVPDIARLAIVRTKFGVCSRIPISPRGGGEKSAAMHENGGGETVGLVHDAFDVVERVPEMLL
jgi:hypothetical protein